MSLAGRWMRRVRFGLLCRSLYRDQYASQIVPSLPAIPCWESQRLIPKRSAGPRATKIGVVSLKALDHHRPNREESAVPPLNYPPPDGRRSSVGWTYPRRGAANLLEVDRKTIARRNTLALVTPTERSDYRLATPLLATPGEALGESIDLIVVATGKREQLSDEFFQPSGALGKTDRSSGEQIGLGNQSSALVGLGLIGRDVDGLLAQTLNETKADWRIFDQKSGRIISPLELHDLSLQRFERK